jgi:branched-chain amino acid transport system substrate-binding protein
VRLAIEDGQCDPATTQTAMSKIYSQNPIATIAEFCSGSCIAAQTQAEKQHVANFIVAAGALSLTQGNKYAIRVNPAADQQAALMADYLSSLPNPPKRVYTIYENTDAGQGEQAALGDALRKKGVTSDTLPVERTLTDFSGIIARVKAAKPDFVTIHMTDGQIIKLAQEAQAQSLNLPMASLFWPSPFLFDAAGASLNGLTFEQIFNPAVTTAEGKKFTQDYQAKFGKDPYWVAATTYDSVMMINAAVIKANSVEPDAINIALHKLQNFVGTSGTFSVDPSGQATLDAKRLLIVKYDAAANKVQIVKGGV